MDTETELEVNEKTRHEDKVAHLQMIQGVIAGLCPRLYDRQGLHLCHSSLYDARQRGAGCDVLPRNGCHDVHLSINKLIFPIIDKHPSHNLCDPYFLSTEARDITSSFIFFFYPKKSSIQDIILYHTHSFLSTKNPVAISPVPCQ